MRVITAPESIREEVLPAPGLSVFLAGGITGCPNWQREAISIFKRHIYAPMRMTSLPDYLTLLNPRRDSFPITDPDVAREQISWEYHALRAATMILFWFPKEAIQPISLFELGAHSALDTSLSIGCHPDYPRKQDVEIQMLLIRPRSIIHDNLADTVANAAQILAQILNP